MNHRVAKKIVDRYNAALAQGGAAGVQTDFRWVGSGASYSMAQVRKAHAMLGMPFNPAPMQGEKAAPKPEAKPEAKKPEPKPEAKKPEVKKPAPKPEEPKVEVEVGAMEVEVKPGPDGKLGTDDDEVKIAPKKKPAKAKAKAAEKKPAKAKAAEKKPAKKDLESLSVADLRVKAKAAGIKGYSKMTKKTLVKALS